MKTFRYKLGHVACETMTVAELVAELNEYPADMPVFAHWEGVRAHIGPMNFEIERHDKGHKDDACDCLVIDVGSYA